MLKKNIGLIIGLIVALGWRCDLPHQPGPMPTEIIKTDFRRQLNVFGVLRADGCPGSSFFSLQRAARTAEMYADSAVFIENAEIVVVDSSSGTPIIFPADQDTLQPGYYVNPHFQPCVGITYTLCIQAPGYPLLTGTTSVPPQPQIDTSALIIEPGELTLPLIVHLECSKYRIALIFAEGRREKTIINTQSGRREVRIQYAQSLGDPLKIVVIAYDDNLSRYEENYVTLIPQAYHEIISTVHHGYGCFGSVSLMTLELAPE